MVRFECIKGHRRRSGRRIVSPRGKQSRKHGEKQHRERIAKMVHESWVFVAVGERDSRAGKPNTTRAARQASD